MIIFLPGMIEWVGVRLRHTWVLILPFVVFIVAPCNAARVCGLAWFINSGLGWMAILYLNNTHGVIRHRDSRSNNLCLVREAAVWLMFVDAMYDGNNITANIRSDFGTRGAFMQEAASFVSFRTRGSDPRVRPARRRHDDKDPSTGSYV